MDSDFKWSFPNKWYYACFIAATLYCAATGIFIALYRTPDFIRFYALRTHVAIGTADLLFAILSLRAYMLASDEMVKPRFWLLPTAVMQILPLTQLPFKAVWAAGLAAWFFTGRRGFRFILLVFAVLFNSGLYIGGPFLLGLIYADSLRSDFFYWNHMAAAAAALVCIPFLLWKAERRRLPCGRCARVITFAAAGLIFVALPGINFMFWPRDQNVRFAAPPARFEKGFAFEIGAADAGLRKPAGDPAPYVQSSESCGVKGCHEDLYSQWLISSHKMAAMTPPYRKILAEFASQFGWEATAFCSKCHNPLSVIYGVPDRPGDRLADRLRPEGISCQYCHAIKETDPEAGNGNARGRLYSLFPSPLKKGIPQDRSYSYMYIIWNMRDHRMDYGKSSLNRGQWCGACHRVDVPHSFTGGQKLILGDTYTTWKKMYGDNGLSCTDCHMPLTTYTSRIHARPDHRIWGINQAMRRLAPQDGKTLLSAKDFDAKTEIWLRGRLPVPKYETSYLMLTGHKKYRAYRSFLDKPATLEISLRAGRSASGIKIDVTLKNNTLSHNFPSSPLDLMESWVEVTAEDAGGRIFFRNCPPDGPSALSKDCVSLGGTPVDARGNPIQKHRFWDARGVRDKRLVPPGGNIEFSIDAPLPAAPKPPYRIKARCLFRRYNQTMNEWVYGEGAPPFPATELSKTEFTMK